MDDGSVEVMLYTLQELITDAKIAVAIPIKPIISIEREAVWMEDTNSGCNSIKESKGTAYWVKFMPNKYPPSILGNKIRKEMRIH